MVMDLTAEEILKSKGWKKYTTWHIEQQLRVVYSMGWRFNHDARWHHETISLRAKNLDGVIVLTCKILDTK